MLFDFRDLVCEEVLAFAHHSEEKSAKVKIVKKFLLDLFSEPIAELHKEHELGLRHIGLGKLEGFGILARENAVANSFFIRFWQITPLFKAEKVIHAFVVNLSYLFVLTGVLFSSQEDFLLVDVFCKVVFECTEDGALLRYVHFNAGVDDRALVGATFYF